MSGDFATTLAHHAPAVVITVIATSGSTPRDVGARMLVANMACIGSIGGGRLEYEAIERAHELLAAPPRAAWHRETRRIILGPDVGQCCGGVVELLFELIGPAETAVIQSLPRDACMVRPIRTGVPVASRPQASMREASPLALSDQGHAPGPVFQIEDDLIVEPLTLPRIGVHIYGAGHVARALVVVLATLPFAITWVDISADRFPPAVADDIARLVTAAPADVAPTAPHGTLHLVMTHSHDLDFEICRALLANDRAAFIGLIGSATKRARFVQRFHRDGLPDSVCQRLVCPIGMPGIPGKAPAAIAVAVAAQLLALVKLP